MDYFKAVLGWMAVLPGVVRNCELFAPVQKRFAPSGRELRLTIDDGPEPLQTPQVLDVLAREGVKADFFVIGKKADSLRVTSHFRNDVSDFGHINMIPLLILLCEGKLHSKQAFQK
jgi:peptidoglycan/xylan/chitin deacetylase (PgdA/CDA1 family)